MGTGENLFGLIEVGARRDAAFEPQPSQLHTLLRASRSLLGDQPQARVRRIVEPRAGDIGDQRQARRACPRFGREIAFELDVSQRTHAPEQVELEARYLHARVVISFHVARLVAADRNSRPRVYGRQQLGSLDMILLARRGDVRCGDHQVAVVGECLGNECLEARILEHLRGRTLRNAVAEQGLMFGPDPAVSRLHRRTGARQQGEQGCSPLHALASRRSRSRSRIILMPSRAPRRTST